MTRTDVTFLSGPLKLAGHLYIPDSYKEGQKLPAIIGVHPAGGVKEQTTGTYCKELADHGFITLAFDRRYQGESEGTPRQYEQAFGFGEDVKSAVTFLSLQPQVDASRIGVLGICAGGGYALFAASSDPRIKAVGTVSAACYGSLLRTLPKVDLDAILVQAGEARIEYAKTGEVKYLPIVPNIEDITEDSPNLMAEGSEYYNTPRGSHPRSISRTAIWAYDELLLFDAFAFIDQIAPRPILLVAGSKADTLVYSQKAYNQAGEPKELYLVEGSTHVDLYDRHLQKAAPKLIEFFKEKL
ncbi:hypothetical protein BGZ79_003006 [Entomortierella chlamydospora]|nr:hypothetical protein BGZ79_003006 [Entomortierella chlamydospora]